MHFVGGHVIHEQRIVEGIGEVSDRFIAIVLVRVDDDFLEPISILVQVRVYANSCNQLPANLFRPPLTGNVVNV